MFTSFLIKYAEIGIKGKNRYLFEDALVRQIKYALKKCEGEFLVHKTQGRIFVDAESEFDYDEVVAHLQRVFGISGICPVVHVQDEGFEKLCETVIDYIAKVYPDCNQTFKVAARRARKKLPQGFHDHQHGYGRSYPEGLSQYEGGCTSSRYYAEH